MNEVREREGREVQSVTELSRLVRMAFILLGQNPQIKDREWEAQMGAYGASRRTARRIVIFAPIAATRAHFRGSSVTIDFRDTYRTRSPTGEYEEFRLDEEPVFNASLRASEHSTARQILAVAKRSGGYKAVSILRDEQGARHLQAGAPLVPLDYLQASGVPEFSRDISSLRKLQLWWHTR